MKKIVLVGDPSVDLLVNHESHQVPKTNHKHTKNLENSPKATLDILPGGVLLLKKFLEHVLKKDEQFITYPEINELLKVVPIRTIAVVNFNNDKRPEVLHVDQFLGYSCNELDEETEQLTITGNFSNADLVIIDDAGNGYRNEANDWIHALIDSTQQFQIIHKINWPFKENKLLQKLSAVCSNKMIAIVSADDLREHGLKISKQLSWDKTVEDFMQEFATNERLRDLRKYGTIIIRFNLEASIVILNKKKEKNEEEEEDAYFFYLPSKYEGQIMTEFTGSMQGITHAFIAGFVKQKLYGENGRNDIITSVTVGMNAAYRCVNFGYVRNPSSSEISYPLDKVFGTDDKEIKTDIEKKVTSENEVRGKDEEEKIEDLPLEVLGIKGYENIKKPESLLEHITGGNSEWINAVALECFKEGKSSTLQKVPVFKIENFKTYDREEIENFRSFNKLINEYLFSKATKPMSVAIFGPPGSGKSFGVKQIVKSDILKNRVELIETNLSQLQTYHDLIPLFHDARDITLSGKKIPLIVFDEFDSANGDKPLWWIKYFLAPMQDGVFKDGEKMHPLGRAIFVFVGGTKYTFDKFSSQVKEPDEDEDKNQSVQTDFKALKVPDFISRLKGFINIKGIEKKDENDKLYVLRRSVVFRSMIEKDYKNLMNDDKSVNIDNDLLETLMLINKFKHGSRSLESIVKMSDLANERSFKKSNLPSECLLGLHIDTSEFLKHMKNSRVFPIEHIENIAKEIHKRWLKKEIEQKSTKVTAVEWEKTNEEIKNSNRGQAIDILRKLKIFEYKVVTLDSVLANDIIKSFPEAEKMAEMEHERWMEERESNGWKYNKIRNDALKHHDNMLSWELLPDEIKKYDRDAVNDIPEILNGVGFAIVKE
jgi:DNA replication protein DnaC